MSPLVSPLQEVALDSRLRSRGLRSSATGSAPEVAVPTGGDTAGPPLAFADCAREGVAGSERGFRVRLVCGWKVHAASPRKASAFGLMPEFDQGYTLPSASCQVSRGDSSRFTIYMLVSWAALILRLLRGSSCNTL